MWSECRCVRKIPFKPSKPRLPGRGGGRGPDPPARTAEESRGRSRLGRPPRRPPAPRRSPRLSAYTLGPPATPSGGQSRCGTSTRRPSPVAPPARACSVRPTLAQGPGPAPTAPAAAAAPCSLQQRPCARRPSPSPDRRPHTYACLPLTRARVVVSTVDKDAVRRERPPATSCAPGCRSCAATRAPTGYVCAPAMVVRRSRMRERISASSRSATCGWLTRANPGAPGPQSMVGKESTGCRAGPRPTRCCRVRSCSSADPKRDASRAGRTSRSGFSAPAAGGLLRVGRAACDVACGNPPTPDEGADDGHVCRSHHPRCCIRP